MAKISASLVYVSFYYSDMSNSPGYPMSKREKKIPILIPAQATIIYVFVCKEVLCPDSLCNNSIYNVIFLLCAGTVMTENQYRQNQGNFQG